MNEIIEDLDFISKIPKGYKPNFSDKSLINLNEWFSTLKRRYKGEQGEKGVIYIHSLLTRIENLPDISMLQKYLVSCKIGLENLVYTYKIDQQILVSNDYQLCYERVDRLTGKKRFFSYTPKMIYKK